MKRIVLSLFILCIVTNVCNGSKFKTYLGIGTSILGIVLFADGMREVEANSNATIVYEGTPICYSTKVYRRKNDEQMILGGLLFMSGGYIIMINERNMMGIKVIKKF